MSKPAPQTISQIWAKPINKIITLVCVIVIELWMIWWNLPLGSATDAGQFGDKFGALNTLFTGLAFVGVIAAFWHEREDAAERKREQDELLEKMRSETEMRERQHLEIFQAMEEQARAAFQQADAISNDARQRAKEHADTMAQMKEQARASQRSAELMAIVCQIEQLNRALDSIENRGGIKHPSYEEYAKKKKLLTDMLERSTGVRI